jgi:hypothetical protein
MYAVEMVPRYHDIHIKFNKDLFRHSKVESGETQTAR